MTPPCEKNYTTKKTMIYDKADLFGLFLVLVEMKKINFRSFVIFSFQSLEQLSDQFSHKANRLAFTA